MRRTGFLTALFVWLAFGATACSATTRATTRASNDTSFRVARWNVEKTSGSLRVVGLDADGHGLVAFDCAEQRDSVRLCSTEYTP